MPMCQSLALAILSYDAYFTPVSCFSTRGDLLCIAILLIMYLWLLMVMVMMMIFIENAGNRRKGKTGRNRA